MEFLKRFCDKSAEVRIHAIQCAKNCYTANPASSESLEVLGQWLSSYDVFGFLIHYV